MPDHIIHKQKVVLNLSASLDAFGTQSRVGALLRNGVLQRLEELFDRLAPTAKTIRMERLDIHLGGLAEEGLEEQFVARLLEKVEQEIKVQLNSGETQGRTTFTEARQSEVEALLFFLRHGRLPWYKNVASLQQWEQVLLDSVTDDDWLGLLQGLKGVQPVVLQRLVYQFSDAFLFGLAAKCKAGEAMEWQHLYADVSWLLQQGSVQTAAAARQQAWTHFLQWLLAEQPIDWPTKLIGLLRSTIDRTRIPTEATLAGQLKTSLAKQALAEAVRPLPMEGESGSLDEEVRVVPNPLKAGIRQSIEGEEVFVSNCGLVILHPFLVSFFKALNLLAGRQFLHSEAHQRAVLLLHYLATGKTEAGEFELVWQKFLCGFPLEETLPNRIALSDQEKEESAALLKAVTEHWPPLKNTSAEGLQQTFLQRDGKLQPTAEGWRLTVEQKTVDVLLGKLPWNLSTFRLPWMEQLVQVDWV